MQIIVDSGYFYAMGDLETKRFAPIIKFMRDWTIEEIRDYCRQKNWKLQEIPGKEVEVDYYCC